MPNATPESERTAEPWPRLTATAELAAIDLDRWATELGFDGVGVSAVDLADHTHEAELRAWLARGFHGSMSYLERNLDKRLDPAALVPGTVRVISVRMSYLSANDAPLTTLAEPTQGYIARYALGRDYHKVLRKRLTRLGERLNDAAQAIDVRYRAFADSAPVLERPWAAQAGLGWIGKHTLLLHRDAGSWFFLGELFTNLPLPVTDAPIENDCGNCRACMTVCPTDAIVEPGVLDARRCVSYLTIEHRGAIPEALRSRLGNRIFGCDDCQLYCPWNRDAPTTAEADFEPRRWRAIDLRAPALLELFALSEEDWLNYSAGSALRRISFTQWQRNLAVALGNAPSSETIQAALEARLDALEQEPASDATTLLVEHLRWALMQQRSRTLA
ncbi:MAG: tRNA epoxyqueuosine(34) reductase QueG [Pseudomonadota bacterium]